MALEQVIGDVRRDGDRRAQKLLDDAKTDADSIIAAAKDKAKAYEQQRMAAAEKDVAQLQAQILSSAEFEARKTVLTAESELRGELRQAILDGFANLDDATRKKHFDALLQRAQAIIAKGTVHAAKADAKLVDGQNVYSKGDPVDIIGGIIVESASGENRLDLSYETLLDGLWRDILKQEAELFA